MSTRKELIQSMLAEDSGDPFLHYALALEWLKEDETSQAIQQLQELRKNHSEYLPVYYQLGKCLETSGDLQMAQLVYGEGIDLAKKQGERKTEGELREALMILEDFIEDQGESS